MVHVGQVIEDVEGQIDVNLVEGVVLFPQLPDLLLLGGSLLRLGERLVEVLLHFCLG